VICHLSAEMGAAAPVASKVNDTGEELRGGIVDSKVMTLWLGTEFGAGGFDLLKKKWQR
jgi:hypothetical protein